MLHARRIILLSLTVALFIGTAAGFNSSARGQCVRAGDSKLLFGDRQRDLGDGNCVDGHGVCSFAN